MARTQRNKATAHHLGLLKAKLAKLKRELLDPAKGSGGGGAGEGTYLYSSLHSFSSALIVFISCLNINLLCRFRCDKVW